MLWFSIIKTDGGSAWPFCLVVWPPGVKMKILNGFYDKAGFVGDWKVECLC